MIAPFGFATAGTIRFGRGVLAEAAPFAATFARVLLVRSASVAAGGPLPRLTTLGLSADTHDAIAQEAKAASSYKANPVDLDMAALLGILARG